MTRKFNRIFLLKLSEKNVSVFCSSFFFVFQKETLRNASVKYDFLTFLKRNYARKKFLKFSSINYLTVADVFKHNAGFDMHKRCIFYLVIRSIDVSSSPVAFMRGLIWKAIDVFAICAKLRRTSKC